MSTENPAVPRQTLSVTDACAMIVGLIVGAGIFGTPSIVAARSQVRRRREGACPLVLDGDGLALSSRNQYLDADGRTKAPGLYRTLAASAEQLRKGDRAFGALEKRGLAELASAGFLPDYFAIRNAADLSLPTASSRNLVVMAAAHLKRARLIDNVLVDL